MSDPDQTEQGGNREVSRVTTINGVDYDPDKLTESQRAHVNAISEMDAEIAQHADSIAQIKRRWAICQLSRDALFDALVQDLSESGPK